MRIEIKQEVNKLTAEMTLDEKLAQIGSYWMFELQSESGQLDGSKLEEKLANGIGQITRVGGSTALTPVEIAKTGNQIQKFLREETRLGIPAIFHEETCTGTMVLGGSMYPQVIGLAATFQPELAEEMTKAIRKQMLAIGGRHALAPVLDLGRDPRWGRIEETFGEDPTLSSQFGVAYINGLQGKNLSEGVMATGKHFIGHSFSQGGLNCGPVHIGMNEIYDLYIAPFQAAIRDANLATVMNSYPELDGEVVAASRRILTDLLRDKLGFDGLVVSDYDAINMLNNYHFVAETMSKAAVMALNAGIDVEWPTVFCYGDPLKEALEVGDINIEMIDLAVERHLTKKFELGLFENPYVSEDGIMDVFETPGNRELARELARRSIVLLKNDGLLPLKRNIGKLAMIGPNAKSGRNQLGDYSYISTVELMITNTQTNFASHSIELSGHEKDDIEVITVLQGIKELVSSETQGSYIKGCDVLLEDDTDIPAAVAAAEDADVVVLVLGDRSGLTPHCTSGETRDSVDLMLPGDQMALAEAVLDTGKPIVAVIMSGRPYVLTLFEEQANAILQVWLPGEEGGTAIAETLFGENNPAGRLPVTFPRAAGQVPIFYNYKPSGMRSNWYVDYVSDSVKPLYEFGFGLSYTQFEYRDIRISKTRAGRGENVDITFTLTNIGDLAGDEVVQLYIRDEFASTPRPMKELKGFSREHLAPGESKQITFHLPVDQLAFINNDLDLVLEAGKVFLLVGSSSEDIKLRGSFTISEDAQLPLIDRVFTCPVTVA
jgi:beta-glucosidase